MMRRDRLVAALSAGGCVSPDEEADVLIEVSRHERVAIEELLARRLGGEPLPWIAGSVVFCGVPVLVEPGVFVPRPHSEPLVRRAAELLPATGIALDLCTGSGAVAAVLATARPQATIVATDIDPVAVACARHNGVDALLGDLDEPVSGHLRGRVDVVTAVVPYVPTKELHLLPRDVLAFEPRGALDGGVRGTDVLTRAAAAATRWLRPGGAVLLELGGDEGTEISDIFRAFGFTGVRLHGDEDGHVRFIVATRPG